MEKTKVRLYLERGSSEEWKEKGSLELSESAKVSGCMRKRIKQVKWRKAGGMAGSCGVRWSRRKRGMRRETVAGTAEMQM